MDIPTIAHFKLPSMQQTACKIPEYLIISPSTLIRQLQHTTD